MKEKFIKIITEKIGQEVATKVHQLDKVSAIPFMKEYGESWLKVKEQTTKPSTFKDYKRTFEKDVIPVFGHKRLNEITRTEIQDYLFSFINQQKCRTAEKIKLQLNCIFDLASEDFDLPSPMKKVVLPYYEKKKGKAFTLEEELQLVDECIKSTDSRTSHALLVMLYFGLRKSELASIEIIDDKFVQCDTSKERMGKDVVKRKIPFTPVFKRIAHYIDFDKAKNVNLYSVHSRIKKLFPTHHSHELRYTFITRCKECGVNPEVVMLWDGHCEDKDVRSSAVDRGYTDYSENYILEQAEKVNYIK